MRLAEVFLFIALVFELIDLVRLLPPSGNGPGMPADISMAVYGAGESGAALHEITHPPAAILNLFGTAPREQGFRDPALEPVRETQLNLVLKGILADRNSDRKLALIAQSDKDEQVYWLGESVAGADIVRIESGRVILNRGGIYEALTMDENAVVHESYIGPVTSPGSADGLPSAENRNVIDKSLLDNQMNDLEGLMRQANAVPHSDKNGRQIGYRVVNLPSGSVFRKLGLRQEDIVQSVNGTSVLNAREALEAYRDLKTANAFSIGLLRDGREITLDYSIQ